MDKLRRGEGREGASTLPSEPNTVAWAHVSDFHFKAKTDYGRDEVMQALLRDLAMVSGQREAKHGVEPVALDFVVVTGDVAYSGQPEQYDVARRFFEELVKATRVPRGCIFVVPGNHDVDRSRDVARFMSLAKREDFEEAWQQLAFRRSLSNEKLATYREFATQLNEHLRAPEEQPGGFAHTLEIRGHKIALLGLSSCWLSGRDGEQGHLLVGKPQLYDLGGGAGLPGLAEADLKLAMLHHPLDWLQQFDRTDLRSLLAEHVDAVLHGHLHEPSLTLESAPGRVLRTIAAGAAYAGSQYPNAYNIARATLGTMRKIDFWLREYVPSHRCFVADNRAYPVTEQGRWTWTLTSAAPGEPQPLVTLLTPAPEPINVRPYLEALIESTRWFDVRGVNTELQAQPELDGVYTRLLVSTPAAQAERADARETGVDQASGLELHDVLRAHANVVLIGDPGSGKSTFLRWVALNLARAALGPDSATHLKSIGLSDATPFPILVRLGDFGQFLERRGATRWPDTSIRHLAEYLDEIPVELKVHLPAGYLWQRVQDGGCFLLLDGLDEVSTETLRRRARAIVEAALKPGNRHVITCRTRAYEGRVQLAAGLTHCRLMDFGPAEVETFVWRWSRAHRGVGRHESGTAAALAADAYGRGLLAAVRAHEHVRRLATNPLMLTILACVYHGRKRLPAQRAELYEEAVTTLLLTRPSPKAEETEIVRREALQLIALHMFAGSEGVRRSVSRAEAARAAAPLFANEDEALTFIEQEELRSGLLVNGVASEVEFRHLTFAEYLVARSLAWRPDYWLHVQPHLFDERWNEVVLLLAGCRRRVGLESASDLITRILSETGDEVDRARRVGLVGRILRDVEPYGGDVARGTGYAEALGRTLAAFEPGSEVSEKVRVEVGEALGQAGDPRIHDDDLKNRVEIEGGTFLMGAQHEEPTARGYDAEAEADETPRSVTFSAFWIDRYLVTVQKFRRFVEAGADGYLAEEFWSKVGWAWRVKASRDAPGSWEEQLRHPNRPVTEVSWYEAAAYCAWMSARHARDGWQVVLPTEAQWEYAARGRDGREYPWGSATPSDAHANVDGQVGAPTPVGIYPLGATPEGVRDLAGNVDEWCADWYGRYETSSEPDPVGPRSGTSRVLRGGAFFTFPRDLRAAYRFVGLPGIDVDGVGFRCVWVEAGRTGD